MATYKKEKKSYFSYWLSPEYPDFYLKGGSTSLFSGIYPGRGIDNLTDFHNPGCWRGDERFTLENIRTNIFFEEGLVNRDIYGHLISGILMDVVIGTKPQRIIDLSHVKELSNRSYEFVTWLEKGFIVPPRQSFEINIRTSPSCLKLIQETKGKKLFKVTIEGILYREVQVLGGVPNRGGE